MRMKPKKILLFVGILAMATLSPLRVAFAMNACFVMINGSSDMLDYFGAIIVPANPACGQVLDPGETSRGCSISSVNKTSTVSLTGGASATVRAFCDSNDISSDCNTCSNILGYEVVSCSSGSINRGPYNNTYFKSTSRIAASGVCSAGDTPTACTVGNYKNEDGDCVACPDGTYRGSLDPVDTCKLCPEAPYDQAPMGAFYTCGSTVLSSGINDGSWIVAASSPEACGVNPDHAFEDAAGTFKAKGTNGGACMWVGSTVPTGTDLCTQQLTADVDV